MGYDTGKNLFNSVHIIDGFFSNDSHTLINYIYGINETTNTELSPSAFRLTNIEKPTYLGQLKQELYFLKIFLPIYYINLLTVLLQIGSLSHIYKELTKKEGNVLNE